MSLIVFIWALQPACFFSTVVDPQCFIAWKTAVPILLAESALYHRPPRFFPYLCSFSNTYKHSKDQAEGLNAKRTATAWNNRISWHPTYDVHIVLAHTAGSPWLTHIWSGQDRSAKSINILKILGIDPRKRQWHAGVVTAWKQGIQFPKTLFPNMKYCPIQSQNSPPPNTSGLYCFASPCHNNPGSLSKEASFKPSIFNQCAAVHWCAMNGLQVCHRILGEGHLLIGLLGDVNHPGWQCGAPCQTMNGVLWQSPCLVSVPWDKKDWKLLF